MSDAPNILSPSFPNGLSGLRSEADVRGTQQKRELTKSCPFCGEDPGLARDLGADRKIGRFQVGCESDDCPVCPQTSGASLSEAWARWNKRAQVLTIVARNSDEVLAGAGGIK